MKIRKFIDYEANYLDFNRYYNISMTPSHELFLLIKSLTRAEKGYFKKFTARHSSSRNLKFLKIFEVVEKQEVYNEQELKEKIKNEISARNFPAAKSYLYEIVLRSLNSFYISSNKDNELKESLRSIEILYRKALYIPCLRLVKKKKADSYRYDNHIQLLELIKWEKNLVHEGVYPGKELDNLEKLYNEEQMIISRLKNLSDLRIFSHRIQNLTAKEGTDEHNTAVKKILAHSMLADESIYTSYTEKINYHHIKSSLYGQSTDDISSYFHKKKMIEMMEEYPFKIKDNPVNYIISLSNLLTACTELNYPEEFNFYTDKIRSVLINNTGLTENTKILALMGQALPLLKMKLRNRDFVLKENELKNIEDTLTRYKGKFNKHDETLCLYLLSIIYFNRKEYNLSLIALNKILKENDNNISPEALINSRIFNVMLHFELGNFQLVEYLTASYTRYFETRNDIDEAQKNILKLFKALVKGSSNEKNYPVKKAAGIIRQIKLKQSSLPIFRYFDFISYFEKLGG